MWRSPRANNPVIHRTASTKKLIAVVQGSATRRRAPSQPLPGNPPFVTQAGRSSIEGAGPRRRRRLRPLPPCWRELMLPQLRRRLTRQPRWRRAVARGTTAFSTLERPARQSAPTPHAASASAFSSTRASRSSRQQNQLPQCWAPDGGTLLLAPRAADSGRRRDGIISPSKSPLPSSSPPPLPGTSVARASTPPTNLPQTGREVK